MEQFATEEQQVEAIKKFWKENGVSIIVGAVIGLGGLWGWRYYNDTQIAQKEAASTQYEQVITALNEGVNADLQAKQFAEADPANGYALLTALQLAKKAVESENYDEAAKHLNQVVANTDNPAIKDLASLRLARVQQAQEAYDDAIATLATVTSEAFKAQVEEAKGDVFVEQQLFDKARAAYSAALEGNDGNALLKMKLDNLAVAANG